MGYRKENIQADYAIQDFAVQVKGSRKELRRLHRQAKQADLINLAVTTVEGIGLGALGIGMPDIVLFLGTLLKGIYETVLHYGFDYDSRQEQLLIPINMRDGSLICTGKGNLDWNCSAPHGAGRLMSRSKAKEKLNMAEFTQSMEGIYTTSVHESTIDEAPMAYKPMEAIVSNIHPTVEINCVIRPIYNFKARS